MMYIVTDKVGAWCRKFEVLLNTPAPKIWLNKHNIYFPGWTIKATNLRPQGRVG